MHLCSWYPLCTGWTDCIRLESAAGADWLRIRVVFLEGSGRSFKAVDCGWFDVVKTAYLQTVYGIRAYGAKVKNKTNILVFGFIFTALRGMQTRCSDKNSVCLSVCPSNAWIVTKRKKISPDFYIQYERSFSLVFWEKEWLVGAPSTWNFGSTGPRSVSYTHLTLPTNREV